MLSLDHLAISCATLHEGAAAVEAALGLPLAPGGQHPHMATHNRLLSLGPDLYLEVIAADPSQPRPAWPRWFDLDRFSGPPRLTNWICRTVALQRGDFRWRMAVPADGILPFDNRFPALIQWEGPAHPAPRLPDHGARLTSLVITHPGPGALRAALSRLHDPRVSVTEGDPALRATIATPQGDRILS